MILRLQNRWGNRREEALTDHWYPGEERQGAGSTRSPSSACRHRPWGRKELWSLGAFCSSDLQGELLSQQKQNPQSYQGIGSSEWWVQKHT